MPLALGILTAFGLIAALLSDGVGDTLSWIALAAPVLVIAWHSVRPATRYPTTGTQCRIERPHDADR